MSESTPASTSQPTRRPGFGAGLVFWLLVLMALATFTPCVLLPEWRHYQALCLAEQMQQHRVDQLAKNLERDKRMLDAVRSDPAVIARVAQRDLRYQKIDETTVPISIAGNLGDTTNDPFVAKPVTLPAPLDRWSAKLPAFDYDAIFCDPKTSSLLMAMSVALLVVAVGMVTKRTGNQKSAAME